MERTNIEFKGFEMPNPIGMGIALIVGRIIAHMSFDAYYTVERVTPEVPEGNRSYIEMTYDNVACHKEEGITFPAESEAGKTTVRIYEGSIAGWADVEFYNKNQTLVYFRKNVLPFYTGSLGPMITEFLLGGVVWRDLEPVQFAGHETSEGWFLEGYTVAEPSNYTVWPSTQDAMAAEPNVPQFMDRVRAAAIELGLTDVAADIDESIASMDGQVYTDTRGFRPMYDENIQLIGYRYFNNNEIMAVAYDWQARLKGEVITPIHPRIQNLMNELSVGWRPQPTQL